MNLLDLTKKLVGFNTATNGSGTQDMAHFISNYLESSGFGIELYSYVNETDGLKKVNLIARKGRGDSRLALSGHMDTVGFKGSWDEKHFGDPLELTFRRTQNFPLGIYCARGIADMKLFLAIAMKAGEAIKAEDLKHSFALCFTSDEEVGCLGARKLIKTGTHIADYIIVGEPTEMIPIYAHKGYVYPCFELFGKKGHSSDPRNGISVIPALAEALKRISDLEKRLKGIIDNRFNPPYPTLNVGVISTNGQYDSGNKKIQVISSKNMLAEYCRLEMEVRTIPGQDSDETLNIINQLIGLKIGEVNVKFIKMRRPTPPMETQPDSLIVKVAEEIADKKAITVAYNTEAGIFNKGGAQSIVWGPGSIAQAHTNNEFVEPKYLQPEVVDMYIRVIRKICC